MPSGADPAVSRSASAGRQGIAQQCPRGDQQVQRAFRAAIRDVARKRDLPSADGAEVMHCPVQPRQPQDTFHKPGRLAKRHPEKHLHGQASLDRGITEGPRPAPLAGGFVIPGHLRIEPTSRDIVLHWPAGQWIVSDPRRFNAAFYSVQFVVL